MYIKQEGMMQMTFTKLPKSITAEELLSTPLPPVKWIIPGLLPAGLVLFAGPSKAGKSWLTLWLCLQIAQGNPVWNREIEPRTVIYFSLEDGCPGYGLPDKLGLAHVAGREPFRKLGVFFLGHACLDYPASVHGGVLP